MGQALRRAAGKARPGPTTTSSTPKTVVNQREPAPEITKPAEGLGSDGGGANAENLLEERDPKFDSMLNQMVGRIRSKPGGKPEMGEAHVVDKYNRPLPKLRDTKPDSGRFEERAAPPGTLNVAQLRHIILLHQGKAEDHNGPMEVQTIAEKFQVDVAEVRRIVQFVSLPPEDTSKQKKNP
ncbi:uncharacterized protein LOC126791716 [Argentina anserina]|uniref:uncharacterized protein LOC126791716 n=1 Tax=Argentina anserina TaxID=57926 RepID=UPI0021769244|nr:uncharacterized protein LOC126791716 [Potentilla anserina]